MKVAATLLALFGSAAAFAPAAHKKFSTAVYGLDDMAGSTMPIKSFDPLNLAEVGSDETLLWFRAAELKNGRVAMLATTGYIVQASGIHFPGMLSKDISFESLSSMKPFDAWDAVPDAGKAQILFTILLAELATESKDVHYTKGGALPEIVFPPVDFSGVSAETLATKKNRELNNGRLAMIAIMSFISANNIPGSVPALSGIDMF
uniref:Plastid light harvesting protein n=1 Tax=Grammatophora oceanica TaxID=210454 RepID=A0A7S1UUW1_9STRA|mmetsp:Transcript_20525/g.30404  ORF Transcript_20525/g.30404 Transcript_20525/m.30404 type:complete len:205 (+) Transcript_20525:86-700(+)|eukprot:CAMPEP_0194046916 /NCGR_PEP_ID=MMETSP0009_2-20130614/22975_1 /TAXON_ID=210454 /ORGANISM="Grammatophora oceanica, Strain CCMP 410" /LENGTH=204 /DNA_ID=CAMNT_0038692385 /DNA_START=76 /DNA_END=690 /DNA_ORIENTATION=-